MTSPMSTESGWAMAKAIVSATACGGIAMASRRAVSDASSSGSRVEDMKSVSVKPGEMSVQRRPSGASSCRITSHRARTADLVAA